MNPLKQVTALGQSIWLDSISRKLLDSGELHRLIEADGIGGVTSNPSIFEKAVREGTEYAGFLADLRRRRPGATPFEQYEALAVRDIQAACDVMKPVYERTKARDGYVSLEVTLHEGETTADMVREAVHLWETVSRPNVMIKVPGTAAGRAACEQLIAAGINVNVTLLFSRAAYADTVEHWLRGLEARAKNGGDLSRVASVASFFVSRIDSAVDKELERKAAAAKSPKEKAQIEKQMGRAAIANAKLAYAHYEEIVSSKRWRDLAKKGAQTQRVLWASTGTKNKKYSDVLYVEELIGPDTVNTAPPATVDAFRDHGKARVSLTEGLLDARKTMSDLERLGVSLDAITDALLVDGLKQFSDAFDTLLAAMAGGTATATATPAAATAAAAPQAGNLARLVFKTSPAHQRAMEAALDDWKQHDKLRRMWRKDASVWTGGDEARWLGWLDAPAQAARSVADLTKFADEVRGDGIRHVLLLGMGGSSLCPDVFARTFGARQGYPTLHVLDSTDPAQILATEKGLDLSRTLVIVASKSGSTLEPSILEAYFWERVSAATGKAQAGRRFVAITDPGSKLETSAKSRAYRRIFHGVPEIGGRFSALSMFGLVPAALIGIDVGRFLAHAERMARACGPDTDPATNPGCQLGAFLGSAALVGRDKLTLIASHRIRSLGGWIEQLVAESTGKRGKAIIPVDLEPLGAPNAYGADRVFVHIAIEGDVDAAQDGLLSALEKAGHPVARLRLGDALELSAEFYRWEIATAVAGSILGIHPFDQPDVEASKIATRELTTAYERSGALPPEKPFFEEGEILLYAERGHALKLYGATGPDASLADVLRAHLSLAPGDYAAFLAYVPMNNATQAELQSMRTAVRDQRRAATCVGFGPRFLHSTGQAYKGGPASGVFLQITRAVPSDLPVPGAKYGFGVVAAAQARGDLEVLIERGRRCVRAHLTGDLMSGLAALRNAVQAAVATRP